MPHSPGAMAPWGGFLTGLAENVEYVLTPAVIVFFIGSYMGSIFDTPAAWQPLWWVAFYLLFVGLNVAGVELSFKVTLVIRFIAPGWCGWRSGMPSRSPISRCMGASG